MKRQPLPRLFSTFVLALVVSRGASLAIEANARTAAIDSITTDEVKQHVGALADDTFEGRETGTRGNRAAGLYIVGLLKKLGIAPAGSDGSYYQTGPNSNNILGLVEGRDPELKDEVILVGATTITSATARSATVTDRSATSTTGPTTTPAAWRPCWSSPTRWPICPKGRSGRSCSLSGTAKRRGCGARNTGSIIRPSPWITCG